MVPQIYVDVFGGLTYTSIAFHVLSLMAPLPLGTFLHNSGQGPYNQSLCVCQPLRLWNEVRVMERRVRFPVCG